MINSIGMKAWQGLRFTPPSLQSLIKRYTSAEFRIWVREHLGAHHSNIPDSYVTTKDRRQFHIGADRIYWSLYMGLEFEPETSAAVRNLLRPKDVVLDIGANFGWYTTLFAKSVGPEGRVFAFEPVPSTYSRLREHIELNEQSNIVETFPCALGAERGTAAIHVFENRSHSCSSLSTLNEESYEAINTPVEKLDQLLEECSVTEVDFLKCDVEGSELQVLRGAEKLLRSAAAPIVLIELNDETSSAFGYDRRDIWNFLSETGYDHFYAIESTGVLRRVTIEDIEDLTMLLGSKRNQVESRLGTQNLQAQAA